MLLDNAQFSFKKDATSGSYAFVARGVVRLLGIPGVEFDAVAEIAFNDIGGAGSSVELDLPEDPIFENETGGKTRSLDFGLSKGIKLILSCLEVDRVDVC